MPDAMPDPRRSEQQALSIALKVMGHDDIDDATDVVLSFAITYAAEQTAALREEAKQLTERNAELDKGWAATIRCAQADQEGLAAHQAVIAKMADELDGIWLDPCAHMTTVKAIKDLLAHPLVVAARTEERG